MSKTCFEIRFSDCPWWCYTYQTNLQTPRATTKHQTNQSTVHSAQASPGPQSHFPFQVPSSAGHLRLASGNEPVAAAGSCDRLSSMTSFSSLPKLELRSSLWRSAKKEKCPNYPKGQVCTSECACRELIRTNAQFKQCVGHLGGFLLKTSTIQNSHLQDKEAGTHMK